MAQPALPIWFQVVMGGGGLVGASALLFNLFKQVTDAKDTHIRRLEKDIARLEKEHEKHIDFLKESHGREVGGLHRELENKKQELDRVGDFRQLLEEAVDDLAREGITRETSATLRKIEGYLTTIEQSRGLLQSSQTAASWVAHKKQGWCSRAVKSALERYPNLFDDKDVAAFEEDITNYLEWLNDSLSYGFYCRIEEYVEHPAVKSPFPYRAALQELVDMKDFGPLSNTEVQYLQDYIEELFRYAST